MKKILIDIYKTKEIYSGLGQFSENFANQLFKISPKNFRIDFLVPKGYQTFRKQELFGYRKANFVRRFFSIINRGYDIWHCLHQFPSHLPARNVKMILTIHDLNFLIEKNDKKKNKYLNRLQKNVERADCITTISNYSKNIIEENIDLKGKRVHTIYNGVVLDEYKDAVSPVYLDGEKFFFSIGIFNEKKKFEVLLPLIKLFDNYKLVIAGNNNTHYGNHIKEQIELLGISERVILPGKISDSDKYWLYKNCEAFLFPSVAEGFGLPVIEAMRVGTPVFLSKHTCLPEIGGDKAFYFETFDAKSMLALISCGLANFNINNEERRNELISYSRKFTWEKCMEQYLDLYNSL